MDDTQIINLTAVDEVSTYVPGIENNLLAPIPCTQ